MMISLRAYKHAAATNTHFYCGLLPVENIDKVFLYRLGLQCPLCPPFLPIEMKVKIIIKSRSGVEEAFFYKHVSVIVLPFFPVFLEH